MLLYSKRARLERDFLKWCEENHAMTCPVNVITWLHINKLLNEKEIENYFAKGEK